MERIYGPDSDIMDEHTWGVLTNHTRAFPTDVIYNDEFPGTIGAKAFITSHALEDANAVRLALAIGEGKLPELPKGVRSDHEQCVLARALSNGWVPAVNSTTTTLWHVCDTEVAPEAFAKASAALIKLGFLGVQSKLFQGSDLDQQSFPRSIQLAMGVDPEASWCDSATCDCGEPKFGDLVLPGTKVGMIFFQNTLPMQALIYMFDKGYLKDLDDPNQESDDDC